MHQKVLETLRVEDAINLGFKYTKRLTVVIHTDTSNNSDNLRVWLCVFMYVCLHACVRACVCACVGLNAFSLLVSL